MSSIEKVQETTVQKANRIKNEMISELETKLAIVEKDRKRAYDTDNHTLGKKLLGTKLAIEEKLIVLRMTPYATFVNDVLTVVNDLSNESKVEFFNDIFEGRTDRKIYSAEITKGDTLVIQWYVSRSSKQA